MIDVSIIIPHFNSPESLSVLLKSIGKRENVEVIVIDDNSNKKTEEYNAVVSEYSDSVLFLKNTGEIKGAGASRNIGLYNAHGEWLLFADADDWFIDGWYEKVSVYFRSNYDIVYFTPDCIDVRDNSHGPRTELLEKYCRSFLAKEKDGDYCIRYKFAVPWSKLVRKKLVDENQIFFDEVMYSNDRMFSTKIGYYADLIAASPEKIYCVSYGHDSLTTNYSEQAHWIRSNVHFREYRFLKDHGVKPDESIPTEELITVINRKYGFKVLLKYIRQVRKYRIPLITRRSLDFSRVIRYIKRKK